MKKLFLIPFIIVLAVGLVFSGCAAPAPAPAPAPGPAPAPAPAPAGPEEILIGFVGPMTGAVAGFGQGLEFGSQAAVEDINRLGGIYVEEFGRKIPVRQIVADNESDHLKVKSLAEDLALRDKVNLFHVPCCPVMFQAPICVVADQYKIPTVVGGGPIEPWMGLRGDSTPPWEYSWFLGFAIATPPEEIVKSDDFRYGKPGYTLLGALMGALNEIGDQTNKKVAVLASDCADGRGWYELLPAPLEKLGFEVVGIDKRLGLFPPATTDFTSIVNDMKNLEVEILIANCRAPDFGAFWRQSKTLGFEPKFNSASEAALFYDNIIAWGGNLPQGIAGEIWWAESYPAESCPGIGGTTAMSLYERWAAETGQPMHQGLGMGYVSIQILYDAVERAGSIDPDKVNQALRETDFDTIDARMKFDPDTHVSPQVVVLGQWQKVDKPHTWDLELVYSDLDFIPETADLLFPIPYD